jgi:hypothetical protein
MRQVVEDQVIRVYFTLLPNSSWRFSTSGWVVFLSILKLAPKLVL